jgi:hypothetical protein
VRPCVPTQASTNPSHYIPDAKLRSLAELLDQARVGLQRVRSGGCQQQAVRHTHDAQCTHCLHALTWPGGLVSTQVKRCIAEFNKVNTRQRLGRVMRAGEFKEKFHGYNVTLRCAVTLLRCAHVPVPLR